VTIPPIHRGEADRFLSLLGKAPETARLRAFPHRVNPRRSAIGPRKGPYDLPTASRWQAEGRGIYLVINDGGDDDAAITLCRAIWVEWDHKPLKWQLQAWREFGLGEPTITVTTGGRSAHLYWVLTEPVTVAEWLPLQAALIELTGADRVNRNASRVMRLPGAFYIGPDGAASGQTRIHSSTAHRYSLKEVRGWLAEQLRGDAAQAEQGDADPFGPLPLDDLPPRPPEALRDALLKVPPFSHGAGQYQQLLGLALRLHVELGAAEAQALLSETCCQAITDLPSYFITTPSKISRGSVWPYLRDEFGIDISRHDLRGKACGGARDARQAPPQAETGDDGPQGDQAPQGGKRGPLLSLEEVRERLTYLVCSGASRQDIEAERIRLAAASDIQAASLRDLLVSIQREHDAELQVEQEARRLRRGIAGADHGRAITLDHLMPPRLAEALQTRISYLPADDVAACMAFLVCVSGVVKLGTELIASRAADYRVPLNLYGALVARSGAKKSPLGRLLVGQPTHELRLDLARQHSRAMADWQEQNRGVKPSERPDPPRAVYLSISDATAEALASQLQVQEERGMGLLLHRDELAGLFGSLNQYRGGRGADSEQLLEAYDGSGFRSLRVAANGGGRFYDRCHLSIWGTIQPAVLRELVADGDASGLWARYCCVPLPEVAVPLPDEEDEAAGDRSDAAAAVLAAACSYVYRLPRASLTLSPQARAMFMQYEARCQGDALAATLPAQGALMGKAPGKVLRVAALLHLLWCWEANGNPAAMAVGDGAVRRAITLIDHLNDWTLSLHEASTGGEASDLMRFIHRLAESEGHAIAWRDVAQRLSKGMRRETDSAAARAAVMALQDLEVGQVEIGARGGWSYRACGALP